MTEISLGEIRPISSFNFIPTQLSTNSSSVYGPLGGQGRGRGDLLMTLTNDGSSVLLRPSIRIPLGWGLRLRFVGFVFRRKESFVLNLVRRDLSDPLSFPSDLGLYPPRDCLLCRSGEGVLQFPTVRGGIFCPFHLYDSYFHFVRTFTFCTVGVIFHIIQ